MHRILLIAVIRPAEQELAAGNTKTLVFVLDGAIADIYQWQS